MADTSVPDFAITITLPSDDDEARQDVYDDVDATLAALATRLWARGTLLVAIDTAAEVDVARIA